MKKGDIIYTPFPFTDLMSSKVRPALVLYTDNTDALIAYITSKDPNSNTALTAIILPDDTNGLKRASYIRVEKLLTIEQKIAWGILGNAGEKVVKEVIEKLVALLRS